MTSLSGSGQVDLRCVFFLFWGIFCGVLPDEGKHMDEAAICGKNMKTVFERRGLKRRKCPDRREDITYASLL